MHAIREYRNPITRELIDLAAEYGLAPEFVSDAQPRGGSARCARFRFAGTAELEVFRSFLVDRGFQATLRADGGSGDACRLVCRAAVAD